MHKKQIISISVIVLVIIGIIIFAVYKDRSNKAKALVFDPKNATYTIDGTTVILNNGLSEISAAPGSASKIVTKYVGSESRGDLDKDGREDVAFVMSQDGGGSGTFYYVASLLNKETGPVSPAVVFFGDRVKPVGTEIKDGIITVNFLDRIDNAPMSEEPSVQKSVSFSLNKTTMTLENVSVGEMPKEVTNPSEQPSGESSLTQTQKPESNLKLDSKTWTWESTQYNNDKIVKPKLADKFTITFSKDNKVHITTDCNTINGTYTSERSGITFGPMMSTRMYCEGSQETDFQKMLNEVNGYIFTDKSELVLTLKFDTGSVIFK